MRPGLRAVATGDSMLERCGYDLCCAAMGWRTGVGASHIVYGRVPARQIVRAGSYADALVITVDF